jgi:hypothetical protein
MASLDSPGRVDELAGAVVRRVWESFEARDWDRAADCLADEFVCEWPQTGERFRGRENFIAMNRAHPAPNWHLQVRRLVAEQSTVAAEVVVVSDKRRGTCASASMTSAGDRSCTPSSTGWSGLTSRRRPGGPPSPNAWTRCHPA